MFFLKQPVAQTVQEDEVPFSHALCNDKMDDFAFAHVSGRVWRYPGHRYVVLI